MYQRITLVVLIFIRGISLAAQPLTIEKCYEKAKRNYPLVKQYDLIDKSAEYNLSNAGKSYLPQFSATGIAGYIIKGLPLRPLKINFNLSVSGNSIKRSGMEEQPAPKRK